MTTSNQEFVRNLRGRRFNKQNEMYMLPVDDEEYDRLGDHHQAVTLTFGLLYPIPELIQSAMSHDAYKTPAAIDVGTGSGHWAIDFANEFPHVSVVGIDLVPPIPRDQMPSNCHFEAHDVNLPLDKYHNLFNVCHIRSIDGGVRNYEDLLYRIPEIIRPGGVLLLAGADLRLYTEDKKPYPVDLEEGEPGWCAVQAMFWRILVRERELGGGVIGKYEWKNWLPENPYFSSFGAPPDAFIPIGPWEYDLDGPSIRAAKLWQTNVIKVLDAVRTMLLSDGLDETTLDRWTTIAKEEVVQMKPRLYSRWLHAWGVRNSAEWVPKPLLS